MSVFRLAKNSEEIISHMGQYIEAANSMDCFYNDFNFECTAADWEAGWVEFVHRAVRYDMNRFGNIHGGVIMMLVDTAAGLTAYETGTGNASPTMDINVNFLFPIHIGDEMVLRAQVLNAGKRTCTVRTEVLVNGELKVTSVTMHRTYSETTPEKPVLLL